MEATKNYGQILANEIKDKGYSKKAICDFLEIAYNTLEARLIDGEFTIHQVEALIKNRYLPND